MTETVALGNAGSFADFGAIWSGCIALPCSHPNLIRSSVSTSSCAARVIQLGTLSGDGFWSETKVRQRQQLENDSILTFSRGSFVAAKKRADSISWSFSVHRRQVRKSRMRDQRARC
jgi:hypothetical protein